MSLRIYTSPDCTAKLSYHAYPPILMHIIKNNTLQTTKYIRNFAVENKLHKLRDFLKKLLQYIQLCMPLAVTKA